MELPKEEYIFEVYTLSKRCFTKLHTNDKTLCAICMLDECNSNNDKIWDRYELKCGHKMHTRCFKKWTGSLFKIKCPYCGINEDNTCIYCIKCDTFGHDCTKSCTICKEDGHDCENIETYKNISLQVSKKKGIKKKMVMDKLHFINKTEEGYNQSIAYYRSLRNTQTSDNSTSRTNTESSNN